MNAKEAIQLAKSYVADVFGDEGVFNVGLEELSFDSANRLWEVTIGFSRQWDDLNPAMAGILSMANRYARTYKIVEIADADREVLSVKNRTVETKAA